MAPGTISNNPAGKPNPKDLVLPDARTHALPNYAQYTLPEEFFDAKTQEAVNLDTRPAVTGIFSHIPYSIFDTVFSVGGLVPKPRNVLNAFDHPADYAQGKIETEMAKRAKLPNYYMGDYTPMDESWNNSQLFAAGVSMALAFCLEAWSGGKNTDGSGRSHYFLGERDLLTGRRSLGSVPLSALMSGIYLTGGSLASQHRILQGDGMSSAEAYMTALNPLTGWPLTFADDDHAFFDYIHADFLASSVHMVYGQYTGRLGGILGALLYAGLLGPSHLAPALEQSLALLRASSFGATVMPPVPHRLLDVLPNTVAYDGSDTAQQAAGQQHLNRERVALQAKLDQYIIDEAALQAQLTANPTDTSVISKIDAVKAEMDTTTKYIVELDKATDRLKAGKVVRFAKAAMGGTTLPALHQRWLNSFSDTVAYDGADALQQAAGQQRISQEKAFVQGKINLLAADEAALRGQLTARPTDARVIKNIGTVENQLLTLRGYIAKLDGIEAKLVAGESIDFARAVTRDDVRNLARIPFESRSLPAKGTPGGDAVDLVEHARNFRALPSDAQKAFLAKFPGKRWAPLRLAYGATMGAFGDGKWRIRGASYVGGTSVGYFINVLSYHYQWGMPWEQSFKSGASVFITLAMNEPWIGGLKASGVTKIPIVMQMLPSASTVNLWWSVTKWDREMMLQRCLSERSNLLHSLDPEYRARVRQRIAHDFSLANDKEKAKWSKPLEDDGCGMPIPR